MKRLWSLSGGLHTFVATALLVAVLLAGCSSGAPAAGGAAKGDVTAGEPKGQPITIGSPLPMAFVDGWGAERAMKLAIEEINAKGGVDVAGTKRPLKLETMDTRDLEAGVPVSEALLAIEKLVLEKKADFLLGGPARSEAALAAMDLVSSYKKVWILTNGVLTPAFQTRIAENYDKYKYGFRITSNVGTVANSLLAVFDEFKNKHGFSKVYIMVQDVAHARGGGDLMSKELTSRGWNVGGPEAYPTGATDYSAGLLKAKDMGAQVLFIWADMPETSILLKQYRDMQLPALPLGYIAAAMQPGFWKATDGKGEYAMAELINAGNAPYEAIPLAAEFGKNYQKKWGVEPEGYGTVSSYQAIYTLVDAIQRAKSIEADAVIKALEQTDMKGTYGRIKFDPKNHQIVSSFDPEEGAVPQIIQWQEGKRVTIFPPKIANGSLKLPPWMK